MSALNPSNSAPRVFIDTSVAVAVLRRDQAVVPRFRHIDPVMSVTVLGELLYGATRAQRPEQQRERIAQLLTISTLLTLDDATADRYASVKRSLELRGARIPENDMWIAAAALRHGLPFATRDGHFDRVPDLIVERW